MHDDFTRTVSSDKSGYINFMEFVCSVWNLLTLPEPDLGSIAYLMKDPGGTSALKCQWRRV